MYNVRILHYFHHLIISHLQYNLMSLVKEFKEFALRGNLIDTAVAFVMGASFGKLTSSFVEGIVLPLISLLTGSVNFNNLKIVLKEATPETKDASGKVIVKAIEEVAIKYGMFISTLLDFLIIAIVVFLIIKAINAMKKKEEAATAPAPETSSTDKLLMEIRDSLKK